MLNKLSLSLLIFFISCAPIKNGENRNKESKAPWNKGAIVTAANPHAVEAAIEILNKGGSAVDAAIAAHLVLGLVEPQSSGLGGGGFMLTYDYKSEEMSFIDGREIAPSKATVDMFMKGDTVMPFIEAWQSGKAVGVPGVVALYTTAHDRYGKLPWSSLFDYAIKLANKGFIVSPRLAYFVDAAKYRGRLSMNKGSKDYFYPKGVPIKKGDLLKNPEYATTLKRISKEGESAFYKGSVAQSIVSATKAEPNPGILDLVDLSAYKTKVRPVICGPYRDMEICTTSPPSSGVTQIMITGLYDYLINDDEDDIHQKLIAFVDAQRLAYADRDHYFGDPDEIDIPIEALINPKYLQNRAKERFKPHEKPNHGDPSIVMNSLEELPSWGNDKTEESAGTTHLSIIDQDGNAVSMTATIESAFGSHRWSSGFLLNNEMTDFSRDVPKDGSRVANAVAPNRRPRSSMSPTMVFDNNNNLLMITGSPGGNSIPAYVSKNIVGVLDWGLDAQSAADYPNIVARGENVKVENSTEQGKLIWKLLKEKGYNVEEFLHSEVSGVHSVVVLPDKLEGAADKRREGIVRTLKN